MVTINLRLVENAKSFPTRQARHGHRRRYRCAGRGNRIVNGQGRDTDIVVASAKALIDALNKRPGMHAREVHAQYSGV